MKLLFLDIDGVMTNDDTIINPNHICSFSKSCVEVLNQILQTHQVKIILTSSWRTVYDSETIHQMFTQNGVIQTPAGKTPSISVICKFNFTNFSQLVFISFEKKNNKRTFVVLREPLLAKGSGT